MPPTRASATSGCRSRISRTATGGCRISSERATYDRDGDDLQRRGCTWTWRPGRRRFSPSARRVESAKRGGDAVGQPASLPSDASLTCCVRPGHGMVGSAPGHGAVGWCLTHRHPVQVSRIHDVRAATDGIVQVWRRKCPLLPGNSVASCTWPFRFGEKVRSVPLDCIAPFH